MLLLYCARVPAALPAPAAKDLLSRLPRGRAADLRRRLAAGGGLASATGLALLVACGNARRLPPLSALRRRAGGKPHWPGGPDFSISHAGGYAACAVAPPGIAIGIDLEPAWRVRLQSLQPVLSESERLALAAGGDATSLWTCKEAVLKAAGAGLADARRAEVDAASGRFGTRHFHLQQLVLDGGMLLAIAASEQLAPVEVRWLTAEDLFPTSLARSGL